MDDLPDKLRRNVVVLSAAIVAITVFHLSFQPTGSLLGFAQVGNVTPFKVWVALTAVLVYMFFRYWFHDETDEELRALVDHYKATRYAAIQRCLTADARAYFLERRPSPRWIGGDATVESRIIAPAYAEVGRPTTVDLTAMVEHPDSFPWSGEVGFTIEVDGPGGDRRGIPLGQSHPYRFPRHVAIQIAAQTWLRTLAYSKSTVDVIVPLGLAALAFIMCVLQLVMAGVKP